MRADFDARWAAEAGAMLPGFREWRLEHPQATLAEIEAAPDARRAVARARLLTDAALASEAAGPGQGDGALLAVRGERWRCGARRGIRRRQPTSSPCRGDNAPPSAPPAGSPSPR